MKEPKQGHPLWHAVMSAAAGRPPAPKELDRVIDELADNGDRDMTAAERLKLRDELAATCRETSRLKAGGEMGEARKTAEAWFWEAAGWLPEYHRPNSGEESTDPGELADLIQQRRGW